MRIRAHGAILHTNLVDVKNGADLFQGVFLLLLWSDSKERTRLERNELQPDRKAISLLRLYRSSP